MSAKAVPVVDVGYSDLNEVESAVSQRRSLRGFTDQSVDDAVISRILSVAARAPSGTNTQPWSAHVMKGAVRDKFCDAVEDAYLNHASEHEAEYKYYPDRFPEPYLSRRRKVGWELYGLLGIQKGDGEKMRAQHAKNYRFFDAPVGMIFTISRELEIGSWLDFGMFLQNVMVVARSHGLETCPQAAFAPFHKVIRAELGIADSEVVVCGMSLGYPDFNRIENSLVTERESLDQFVTFHE